VARRGRGGGSVVDMVRTLAVFGLLIGVVVAVRSGSRQTGSAVRRVDDELAAQVQVARRFAGFPVLAPQGLPSGWAPTSARFSTQGPSPSGHPLLHAGWVTPGGRFADLEESDVDVSAALDPVDGTKPVATGTAVVGGTTFAVRRSQEGTVTLLGTVGTGTWVGVTGGATQAELEELLRALR